jgi:ribA/ribD-fused uncharacterized protein
MKQELKESRHTEQQDNSIIGFSKKTGYEFLSNFYRSTVAYEGILYPTVEHAYQASKSSSKQTRELIKKAETPYSAKRLGKSIELRQGWAEEKINIMKLLIHEKFENPFIRWKLKDTAPLSLINENRWNDKFWGVCNGVGENHLGKILMEVREEIILVDLREV